MFVYTMFKGLLLVRWFDKAIGVPKLQGSVVIKMVQYEFSVVN